MALKRKTSWLSKPSQHAEPCAAATSETEPGIAIKEGHKGGVVGVTNTADNINRSKDRFPKVYLVRPLSSEPAKLEN